MRWLALAWAITACGHSAHTQPAGAQDITYHTALAADDEPPPPYDKSELQKALIAERGAEASADRSLSDLEEAGDSEKLRVAQSDLAVRRRFIASLEVCEASGRYCPPRLDDPPWSYPVDAEVDP